MKAIADIHCHPTLHQFTFYNVGKKRKDDLWWDNPPKDIQRNSEFPEFFQCNMPALVKGNVKLVVAVLYPIEQKWFNPALIGTGSLTDILAKQFVVDLPTSYINVVQNSRFNYFEYLEKEFEFLEKNQGIEKETLPGWKYVLPNTAYEVEKALSDDKTIVMIPSVEGAHSLISGNNHQILNGAINMTEVIANVEKLKSWSAHPLYITFAHHFYNGFCGHCKSIPGIAAKVLSQQVGLNVPINDMGMQLIDALLGINNYAHHTKRILIDTKHMSIASRLQYHEKIRRYNESNEDTIPIIASHMGYGNHKTMSDSIIIPDNVSNKYDNSSNFNPWSINLSDQEIVEIYQSKGIIGLNLDQRVLSGNDRIEEEKELFSNRDIKKNTEEVKQFWTERVADNILGIIGAIVDSDLLSEDEKNNAWTVLSLGTDFDGMINPVDSFITSDEFPSLRECLIKYMPQMRKFKRLSMGKPVEELVDLILSDNAYNFIIKNY
ncbi:hypothetical protein [Saccharicrinis aurantiacus]|uniref:hypothetical protein n=1 Tax=Saccharicrinis aurantiacus TaxID=1849719 RepID=UPI0008398600|nr:hypothetical protein [Saccharicrinis aurantiacus]